MTFRSKLLKRRYKPSRACKDRFTAPYPGLSEPYIPGDEDKGTVVEHVMIGEVANGQFAEYPTVVIYKEVAGPMGNAVGAIAREFIFDRYEQKFFSVDDEQHIDHWPLKFDETYSLDTLNALLKDGKIPEKMTPTLLAAVRATQDLVQIIGR